MPALIHKVLALYRQLLAWLEQRRERAQRKRLQRWCRIETRDRWKTWRDHF